MHHLVNSSPRSMGNALVYVIRVPMIDLYTKISGRDAPRAGSVQSGAEDGRGGV